MRSVLENPEAYTDSALWWQQVRQLDNDETSRTAGQLKAAARTTYRTRSALAMSHVL